MPSLQDRRSRSSISLFVVVGLLLGNVTEVKADSGSSSPNSDIFLQACDQLPACRGHLDQADRFHAQKQYSDALREYQAAYALQPYALILYNIARLKHKMGRFAEAVDFYQRYLDTSDQRQAERARTLLTEAQEQVKRGVAANPLQPALESLFLVVTVTGPGRVVSQPPGLVCGRGPACTHTFLATSGQTQIALQAEPTGAASSVIWSGAQCKNSTLTDPRHCVLPLAGGLNLTVGFARSSVRKTVTGVLGALAGVGIVTSAVMFGMTGRNAGGCVDRGTHDSGCLYNLAGPGVLTAGLAVGLGVGATLAWWLPTAKENK